MKRVLIIAIGCIVACTLSAQQPTDKLSEDTITYSDSTTDTTTPVSTQINKKNTFWSKNKITYGGSFGFNLNRYDYYLMLMPEIGYQLFTPWHFAVAPKYSYYNDYDGLSEEHTLGVRISTRVDLIKIAKSSHYATRLFILLAYVYEHQWDHYRAYDTSYFDAGIGIRQGIGTKGSLYVMAGWHLYDSSARNWFTNPIPAISVGVEF